MLYTAFILGLLGSFHCVGMCGAITLLLPLDRKNPVKKAFQVFLYHFGKAISYVLLGILAGFVGKGLFISEYQQFFSIFIGILMLLVVFFSFFLKKISFFEQFLYVFIGKIKKLLGKQLTHQNRFSTFLIGFFNGFLPCGLVYMALFAAIGQTQLLDTVAYMFLFALGTAPLLTLTIFIGNFLTQKSKHYIQKAIPFVVGLIAILFILRGLGLGIPYVSPSKINLMIKNDPDCIVPMVK